MRPDTADAGFVTVKVGRSVPSWSSLAGEASVRGVDAAGMAGVVVVGVEGDAGVAGADWLPQLAVMSAARQRNSVDRSFTRVSCKIRKRAGNIILPRAPQDFR